MLDIYPAREKPLSGITSEIILANITAPTKAIVTKEQVLSMAKTDDSFDVLTTVGAGDIDTLVPQLKLILTERWK